MVKEKPRWGIIIICLLMLMSIYNGLWGLLSVAPGLDIGYLYLVFQTLVSIAIIALLLLKNQIGAFVYIIAKVIDFGFLLIFFEEFNILSIGIFIIVSMYLLKIEDYWKKEYVKIK